MSEASKATMLVSGSTWGYSGTVGEWIANVAIPDAARATSLAPLWYVLRLAIPLISPLHRLRRAIVSWGEFDANGEEQDFHELEKIEDVDWQSLSCRLKVRLTSEHRPAVSTLFLELDTWIVSDAESPPTGEWAEASAELQVSFLSPELHPLTVSLMYSTTIDVWLPLTYDQGFASRSNQPASAANLPRLEALLASLAEAAGAPLQRGQSKLYADVLTPTGFHPAYTLTSR
jgi:hypothetical protein